MNLEATVEYLDLASFFFVTPEIIGRGRVEQFYQMCQAYFGFMVMMFDDGHVRAAPPPITFRLAIATLFKSILCAIVYGALIVYWLWGAEWNFVGGAFLRGSLIFLLGASFLMAAFCAFSGILILATGKSTVSKGLLLIGGCFFVAARIIAIRHAG